VSLSGSHIGYHETATAVGDSSENGKDNRAVTNKGKESSENDKDNRAVKNKDSSENDKDNRAVKNKGKVTSREP
jgi:hypothetical protein